MQKIRQLRLFKDLVSLDSNRLIFERNAIAGRWLEYAAAVFVARRMIGLLDKEIARRDLPAQPTVRLTAHHKRAVLEQLEASNARWYHFWK